jgi:hypothetical protein
MLLTLILPDFGRFCVAGQVPVCSGRIMEARFRDRRNDRAGQTLRARSFRENGPLGNNQTEICQYG